MAIKKTFALNKNDNGRFTLYRHGKRIVPSKENIEILKQDINLFLDSIPLEHDAVSLARVFQNGNSQNCFVYILESNGLYKIGKAQNIVDRMVAYRSHNPKFVLIKAFSIPKQNNKEIEDKVLAQFKKHKVHGDEWFLFNDKQLEAVIAFIEKSILST